MKISTIILSLTIQILCTDAISVHKVIRPAPPGNPAGSIIGDLTRQADLNREAAEKERKEEEEKAIKEGRKVRERKPAPSLVDELNERIMKLPNMNDDHPEPTSG